jgi:hypothetical protein
MTNTTSSRNPTSNDVLVRLADALSGRSAAIGRHDRAYQEVINAPHGEAGHQRDRDRTGAN